MRNLFISKRSKRQNSFSFLRFFPRFFSLIKKKMQLENIIRVSARDSLSKFLLVEQNRQY